ncbi:MAG: glycosyltransferase family 4 protein [Patescibacteria group bacterium]
MRIAILTNAFPPDARGGAGRIAGVYADLLKQHGHEIRVWGPKPKFRELGMMRVGSRSFFHLSDLSSEPTTVQQVVAWKPDVLLTHNLTGCGFGTPRAIRSKGIRWVHVLHDVQLIEPSGVIIAEESMPLMHAVWRRFWSSLRHAATKEPDAVASPTKWLLDFHQSFGWFKKCEATVIPNPVGVQFIAPVPSVGMPEGVMNHAPTSNVLFVGRLDWDKGIDVLIDAWKNVHDVASKLVLIGDGSWKEKISQLGDASIELRGQQLAEAVEQAMRESAVVAVPSRVLENQPTVILEAASADCRIVAADVGGVSETLGNAGWIIPPDDVAALSSALHEALTKQVTDEERRVRQDLVARHDPQLAVAALTGLLASNLKT